MDLFLVMVMGLDRRSPEPISERGPNPATCLYPVYIGFTKPPIGSLGSLLTAARRPPDATPSSPCNSSMAALMLLP